MRRHLGCVGNAATRSQSCVLSTQAPVSLAAEHVVESGCESGISMQLNVLPRPACLSAVVAIAAFVTGCGGHERLAGTVLFQSDRSGRDAWYAVRPDGSGLSKLPVRLPADGADVYWAEDGTKALVMYDTGRGSAVGYVFDAANATRRHIPLPEPEAASPMPWSPDGKRLVLFSSDGDVVLDVRTGTSIVLSDQLADDLLTWSPDGKHLLFSSGRSLYTVPANGGPPSRILRLGRIHPRLPSFADEPGQFQWSSDGRWISFLDQGLYAVRSDGTGLRLIDRGAEEAAWSPTAEQLVFPRSTGLVLADLGTGRRRQLTHDQLDHDPESLAWSPDGKWIVYLRNDLAFGAEQALHGQLWIVNADGTDQRPVTHAFPDGGSISNASAQWVAGNWRGMSAPRLHLASVRATRRITTAWPIVALGAEGNQAAVAQGFGGLVGKRKPLGPIVVWNRLRDSTTRVPVRGCARVPDVLLAGGHVAYRCDNSGEGYTVHDSLRLGTTELVRTHGEEFSGSFLGGLAADRGSLAFDVTSAGARNGHEFRIHRTRVWKSTGARTAIVRTFRGAAAVASLDAGRIAIFRESGAVSVLSAGGGMRTFTFGGPQILGATLDGPRLLVLQRKRLIVFDLGRGRRTASWPIRRGFGPAPELEDAQGDLATYVVGVAVHVLRLSDGRDLVIDTPTATEPASARFVPRGLFYSYNESYDRRPGRLLFVARSELERALASKGAAR
jgi:dipeptidyl aminopeptidase/acylaminoacyl peptidase